jgi:hypothetical protein
VLVDLLYKHRRLTRVVFVEKISQQRNADDGIIDVNKKLSISLCFYDLAVEISLVLDIGKQELFMAIFGAYSEDYLKPVVVQTPAKRKAKNQTGPMRNIAQSEAETVLCVYSPIHIPKGFGTIEANEVLLPFRDLHAETLTVFSGLEMRETEHSTL